MICLAVALIVYLLIPSRRVRVERLEGVGRSFHKLTFSREEMDSLDVLVGGENGRC